MRSAVCTIFAVLVLSLSALGQTQTGRMLGTVTDSSGAVVPGSTVVVTNVGTNQSKSFITDAQGRYVITELMPGEYQISVEVTGFKKFVQTGIVLRVNDSLEIPIKLEVGALTEVVNVSAAAPLLNTSSAALGEVVENKMILDLPLNGRQTLSLVVLTPGVVPNRQMDNTAQNFNRAGNFSVGGARGDTNELLLDGVPNTLPEGSTGSLTAVTVFPSVDSTQEFKVQSNAYSAEFGRTGGGVVNIVTKSGTNDYHGSAYEFLRNSVFDANNFFNNANGIKKASFKQNQFGATLGGPIRIPGIYNGKNRLFFFFSYEGLRQRPSLTSQATVPTDLEKAGDFSQTFNSSGKLVTIYDPKTSTYDATTKAWTRQAFSGNKIPASRFDPIMKNVMTFWPEPNQPGAAFTRANNYVRGLTRIVNDTKFDSRLDFQISKNQQFFFRASHGDRTYTSQNFYQTAGDRAGALPSWYQSIAVGDTITLGSRYLIDIKYVYNYLGFLQSYPPDNGDNKHGYDPTLLGFPQYIKNYAQFIMFPGFSYTGYSAMGQGDGIMWSYQEGHSGLASLSRISGAHVLKIGVDQRLGRQNRIYNIAGSGQYSIDRSFTQGPNALVASTSGGNAIATALLGYPASGTITQAVVPAIQSWYNGYYIQDDWRLTQKTTLNLGLRYDHEWPETERYNHISWFDPGLPSPIAGKVPGYNLTGAVAYASSNQRSPYSAPNLNFAPRVGVAYQVADGMVVRAGYGIFYAPAVYGIGGPTGPGWSASTPFVASIDGVNPIGSLGNPFPSGFYTPTALAHDPSSSIGAGISWPDFSSTVPYVQQWNLNIQRKIGTAFVVDLAYSGAKGTHLQDQPVNYNQLHLNQLSADVNTVVANPFYGIITTPGSALATATITKGRLMVQYPQYTSAQVDRPGSASSIFHSVQVKVVKRFAKGYGFLSAYTIGKLIDDNSGMSSWLEPSVGHQDFYNRRADRAIGDQDVSQRIINSFNAALPFGRSGKWGHNWSGVVDNFLGGWQVNGMLAFQTGVPLSVSTTNTSNSFNSALRPNNNGGSAKKDNPTIQQWFNTSVFTAPALYTFGNLGRNLPDVRGPGVANLDFSVFKNFKFGEGRFVQFRSEFFNLANRVEFNNPDTSLQSGTFGQLTSQRNIPRQIQFGLKIVF